MHHSIENWSYSHQQPVRGLVVETQTLSGVSAVGWYGMLDRNLVSMIEKAESDHSKAEADKLRQFLQTWRANKITGSINREDVLVLQSAAAGLAVDDWKLKVFFSALNTSLQQILASQEQLPGGDSGFDEPRSRPSISPPSSMFGPEAGMPKPGEPGALPPKNGITPESGSDEETPEPKKPS